MNHCGGKRHDRFKTPRREDEQEERRKEEDLEKELKSDAKKKEKEREEERDFPHFQSAGNGTQSACRQK